MLELCISFLQPEFGFSDTHSRASVLWLKCTGLAIHKFPDPRYSENSHKERFQWDFRFYERYIRKNGQWRKSCATPRNFQSANAKHSSAHALTHGTWKSCIASQWRYFLCISNRIYSVFFLFFLFLCGHPTPEDIKNQRTNQNQHSFLFKKHHEINSCWLPCPAILYAAFLTWDIWYLMKMVKTKIILSR